MLEPLVEPNLQHFPSSRKRAMTGLKVIEEEQAEDNSDGSLLLQQKQTEPKMSPKREKKRELQ